MMRVEVGTTPNGWAYCLVDDITGRRITPPNSVGFLWRRTATRAGLREARRLDRIAKRRDEEENARRYAKWERT